MLIIIGLIIINIIIFYIVDHTNFGFGFDYTAGAVFLFNMFFIAVFTGAFVVHNVSIFKEQNHIKMEQTYQKLIHELEDEKKSDNLPSTELHNEIAQYNKTILSGRVGMKSKLFSDFYYDDYYEFEIIDWDDVNE